MIDGNTARPLPSLEPDAPPVSPQSISPPAPEPPPEQAALGLVDWLIVACLVVSVGVTSIVIAGSIPLFLLQSMDFWFEADTIREVSNMTSTTDDHSRTSGGKGGNYYILLHMIVYK